MVRQKVKALNYEKKKGKLPDGFDQDKVEEEINRL